MIFRRVSWSSIFAIPWVFYSVTAGRSRVTYGGVGKLHADLSPRCAGLLAKVLEAFGKPVGADDGYRSYVELRGLYRPGSNHWPERSCQLRHDVTDIKYYYEGDVRFLEQF